MRSACALSLLLWASGLYAAEPGRVQSRYDLGGPCRDDPRPDDIRQIRDAEKAGDSNRVLAIWKLHVRGGCSNQYRWYSLVDALLQMHRRGEATMALEEMDARGFDLNPAFVWADLKRVALFLDSAEFRESAVGKKIKRLEGVSDQRRIRFQKIFESMASDEKPPENYIAKGACPFECCRYGKWTVVRDTELVDGPEGMHVIGKALKGTAVSGVTGEVHLQPEPVVVVWDHDLPKDRIVFVLDSVGEGFGNVYAKGKVVQVFLGYAKYCFRPSENCWGETLFPSTKRKKPVWWVKIRLPNGVEGWTDKAGNFDGKDSCA